MHMPAGQFKARCLHVMDEVQKFHDEIIITKRGKPVAKLVPVDAPIRLSPFGSLKGTLQVAGDLIQPTGEVWDADR